MRSGSITNGISLLPFSRIKICELVPSELLVVNAVLALLPVSLSALTLGTLLAHNVLYFGTSSFSGNKSTIILPTDVFECVRFEASEGRRAIPGEDPPIMLPS